MNVQATPRRVLLLATAAAVGVVLAAGTAGAAGTSLSLELKGQYAKRHHVACGKAKVFRVFHRRSTIEFRGFETPPPAGHFSVRLELKRCVRGRWVKIGDRFTLGKKLTGKYKGFFSARPLAPRPNRRRAITFYEARAIVTGATSPNAYFAVTR